MFDLMIVTPEKIVYQGQVKAVVIPGTLGFFEVLTNHAPIISSIKQGELRITDANEQRLAYAITGGLFEFSKNKATVLADAIEEKHPKKP
jgi:F-type H+-transporting ATPase subunit epsilon